jgi:glycosyltransferase involved in cell wall biosynthesis
MKNNIDNFLIVGLVRNCADSIDADICRLQSVFCEFKNVSWLLVESDSSDNTLSKLNELANKVDHFKFVSLGDLRNDLPIRTQRLAFCRNKYLEEFRTNSLYESIDYVALVDLDGINNVLSKDALMSCWENDGWDVCTANQAGPYYDIWALRHAEWSPNDCYKARDFLVKTGVSYFSATIRSVYSKMIRISPKSDWIAVSSAFGGFAIYKRSALDKGFYVGLDNEGFEVCEHVGMHQQMIDRGLKIFINPKMINATYTEHTIYLNPLNILFLLKIVGLKALKFFRGFLVRSSV